MDRNHKPVLASNQAARVVSAIAAAALTGFQFYGVVSLAEQPPMAMAGHRSDQRVAESTREMVPARHALATLGEKSMAR